MHNEDAIISILRKLSNIESHIINLIIPIQGVNEVFSNPHQLENLINHLKNPLKIDDRNISSSLSQFRDFTHQFEKLMLEFREDLKFLDLDQTFGEIKYIGKRLNEIESTLKDIKIEGIRKNIHLDFNIDGYQMVKKPIGYDPQDPIEKPDENLKNILDTLSSREAKSVIHRLGLFGEKKKTYEEVGEVLGVTRERSRQIFAKSIRKLRHTKRKELLDKITHSGLRKEVFGE